jgi:hypothetical protein
MPEFDANIILKALHGCEVALIDALKQSGKNKDDRTSRLLYGWTQAIRALQVEIFRSKSGK